MNENSKMVLLGWGRREYTLKMTFAFIDKIRKFYTGYSYLAWKWCQGDEVKDRTEPAVSPVSSSSVCFHDDRNFWIESSAFRYWPLEWLAALDMHIYIIFTALYYKFHKTSPQPRFGYQDGEMSIYTTNKSEHLQTFTFTSVLKTQKKRLI